MISLISEHLSTQQEEIQHVLEAAEESTTLLNQVRHPSTKTGPAMPEAGLGGARACQWGQ